MIGSKMWNMLNADSFIDKLIVRLWTRKKKTKYVPGLLKSGLVAQPKAKQIEWNRNTEQKINRKLIFCCAADNRTHLFFCFVLFLFINSILHFVAAYNYRVHFAETSNEPAITHVLRCWWSKNCLSIWSRRSGSSSNGYKIETNKKCENISKNGMQ